MLRKQNFVSTLGTVRATFTWFHFWMILDTSSKILIFISKNYLLGKRETSEMADRNKEVLLEVSLALYYLHYTIGGKTVELHYNNIWTKRPF